MSNRTLSRPVARAIRDILNEAGEPLEIDGIGSLQSQGDRQFLFTQPRGPRVFLSYVHEDMELVRKLRLDLHTAGMQPWMDQYEILAGQPWRRTIQRAIRMSDFYVPCFSRCAVRKRGTFQRELRYALRCNDEFPLDEAFVMPVRLEDCEVPFVISSNFQYVDLFTNWEHGVSRLILAIRTQLGSFRKKG